MTDRPTTSSELLLYQTEDGRTRIHCRFEGETIWLSQALVAELFQKDERTINEHLTNIYAAGEFTREATIRKSRLRCDPQALDGVRSASGWESYESPVELAGNRPWRIRARDNWAYWGSRSTGAWPLDASEGLSWMSSSERAPEAKGSTTSCVGSRRPRLSDRLRCSLRPSQAARTNCRFL